MNIYDFKVKNNEGKEVSLSDYKNKVVLIINSATECGFTPQYEPIEDMYEKYHDRGLEVLDIPCNQFGGQAPGSDDEIHEFCTLNYNTTFPQLKKSDVNGENELPLYTFLKSQKGFEGFGDFPDREKFEEFAAMGDPDFRNNANIKWNFTKFVVDRKGEVVARFEPTASLEDVEKCVASLL